MIVARRAKSRSAGSAGSWHRAATRRFISLREAEKDEVEIYALYQP
jgi:hypothetical protein